MRQWVSIQERSRRLFNVLMSLLVLYVLLMFVLTWLTYGCAPQPAPAYDASVWHEATVTPGFDAAVPAR